MTVVPESSDITESTSNAPPTKILLDSPAKKPAGVSPVANALGSIIESSEPQFAIGIFGEWGSGKTTLMDAVERHLHEDKSVVVRFSAWRFEREQQLLIPLLDAIRASLAEWGKDGQTITEARMTRAREVAVRIGRVVRALASGVSGEIGISGAVKVKLDPAKTIDMLTTEKRDDPERPGSLYFAGFQELAAAFDEFSKDGAARIVVFVDDLDRCLPANALEVLESMKLFFDLPGFVFVAGLDEEVVERAVRTKLRQDGGSSGETDVVGPVRLGREYVRKIFQVRYSLPPIVTAQVGPLLEAICAEAGVQGEQLEDLRQRMTAFLFHVAVDDRINPREVKRFINAYTLQMLVSPALKRDTVLALQTIIFRDDWDALYSALLADSVTVADALGRYRGGDAAAQDEFWPPSRQVPSGLLRFIRSPQAGPLLDVPLEPYLFSVESAHGLDRSMTSILRHLGRLRRLVRGWQDASPDLDPGVVNRDFMREVLAIVEDISRSELLRGGREPVPLRKALDGLTSTVEQVDSASGQVGSGSWAASRREFGQRLADAVEDVAREFSMLRVSGPAPF